MKAHYLKTWPEPYEASEKGLKPFEIRRNDRNFQVGDILVLQEWRPATEEYTGRKLVREVAFILDNPRFGIKDGFVVMAVKPAELKEAQ